MTDARHLPTLDGVRGLSALLVLFSHAYKVGLPQLVPVDLGSYGVMLFFVLSGFLMGHLYLEKPFAAADAARYAAARVARIVPLYFGVIIASFLIFQFVTSDFHYKLDAVDLARHLAFIGSESVFWSIGPEFQFYFAFLILWWAAARARDGAWLGLALVLAGAALIFVFQPWFPGITAPSKLHIFLAGIALALLRRRFAERLAGTRTLAALQLVALGLLGLLLLPAEATGSLFYSARHDPLLNVYFGSAQRLTAVAVIVLGLSFASPVTNLLFANRLARSLGDCSFSIYLLHLPVLWLLERLGVFAATGPAAGLAVGLIAVYLTGMASFRLIERPAQRLLRKPLAQGLEAGFAPLLRRREA